MHRPTHRWSRATAAAPLALVATIEYGESAAAPPGGNLRGQVWRACDGAGEMTYTGYDLSGRATPEGGSVVATNGPLHDEVLGLLAVSG